MIAKRIKQKTRQIISEQKWLRIRETSAVDDRKCFFESYSASNFQGNVYYLFKRMFFDKRFRGYTFVVAAKNISAVEDFLRTKGLFDGRVIIAEYLSDAYIGELYSSKYIFNNVSFPMNFVKKESQIYVNTWHGTPLKHIGKRASADPLIVQNMQRDFLTCDYLISPNSFTTKIFEEDFNVRGMVANGIQEIGYPRNEIFYDVDYRESERRKLGLEKKKVIFYMPTWRSGTGRKIDFIKEMERLSEKLGNEYLIYIKLHPLDSSDRSRSGHIRYMPDHYEVYEFLQCCDILITDYSSVLFDYSNTGRPVILYQFDRNEYFNMRGVYDEITNMINLPIAVDMENLVRLIKEEGCLSVQLKNSFCLHDGQHPTEKVIEMILREGDSCEHHVLCDIEVVWDENYNCKNSKRDTSEYKKYFYLIPCRSNHFFQKREHLLDCDFIVGSSRGQYTYKEWALKGLAALFPHSRFSSIVSSADERERKRMLGNIRIHRIIASGHIPDYLKSGYND